MNTQRQNPSLELDEDLTQVLGYLNFSSGKPDAKTLSALNRLYGRFIVGSPYAGMPPWLSVQQSLQDKLSRLQAENPTFRDGEQASSVLQLVWLHLLPAYLDFHRDLLFHQEPEGLFNGFFLGRAMEAVLQQGPPWDNTDRIVSGAIRQLNHFVGYRPVAVLERQRLEPYPNEWVATIPLYIRNVGAAQGIYFELFDQTMRLLRQTSPVILQRAYFDLDLLDEIALDPRAYDFDHPVNRRPNHHFGLWDPHSIDLSGYYRRFVVQQVTLDALLARISQESDLPREEMLFEAASVLAGTILMASGICGNSPSCFASTVSMASLLPTIAAYRDDFYNELLAEMPGGAHSERLGVEKSIRRQAFGGARQHLNQQLARHRASQLEHVQLAHLFARLGYGVAAKEQSDFVPVASARILCRVNCLITAANLALQRGDLVEAAKAPGLIMDLVRRGIQCGAIVDPWNMLGFAGNFNRFNGPDSSVHDHRVDELVALMEQVFAVQSRVWREAAANNDDAICIAIEREFRETATWWRQFAAHEVSELEATDPEDSFQSAALVAKALRLWYQGGASTGDVKFWAPHAALFDSPKAYALVIEALLEREDFVASMSLLIHWLSQASEVGLYSGATSFSELAKQWLQRLLYHLGTNDDNKLGWPLIEKFFDYLEANADDLWNPPQFQLKSNKSKPSRGDAAFAGGSEEESDSEENVLGAAWEEMVYKDSTDDGTDAPIYEEESETQDELQAEALRLGERLEFLGGLVQLWKMVALLPASVRIPLSSGDEAPKYAAALNRWSEQASVNRHGLVELLNTVRQHRVPRGGSDPDSMTRYDRRRLVKESLLDRIINTTLDTSDARRMLLAALLCQGSSEIVAKHMTALENDDRLTVEIFAQLMQGDTEKVRESFNNLLVALRPMKLLYVPLARGGDPADIYAVRLRRRVLTHLLSWLPRQGLFLQACQLVETARYMENHNPVGSGAVTEFDELYQMAYKSMVRALVRNAFAWENAATPRRLPLAKPLKKDSDSAGSAAEKKSKPSTSKAKKLSGKTDAASQSPIDPPNDPSSNITPTSDEPWTELDELDFQKLKQPSSGELILMLERLTEVLLNSWLAHSRTLRLSVLETVDNATKWQGLVKFIESYGAPLFTQSFLKLSSVRAILHQGVGVWLRNAATDEPNEELTELLDAIDRKEIARTDAERYLSIVLEAVIDHYAEYRDYNSTTTQSDRGEMLYMLLDFLRLRVRYDRVCWNLKPVFWAHEILVRNGCEDAAKQWRQALGERISREAEQYVQQLRQLQDTYAMRMPTVADRVNERFIKPMTIDRMRALIKPSVMQLRAGGETPAFEILLHEAKIMTQEPTGVGLDTPAWLQALEEEADRVLENARLQQGLAKPEQAIPWKVIMPDDFETQLKQAAKQSRTLNLPGK